MPVSASIKLLNMAVLSYQEKEIIGIFTLNYHFPVSFVLTLSRTICREHRENFISHGFDPLVKCKNYFVTITTEVFIL